jgi:hypothetical protein
VSQRWYNAAAVRIAALVVLFGFAAFVEAAHQGSLKSLASADFFWHLRVGDGILATHSLPHTGLYSQLTNAPWIASSWLFDVKVALVARILGLLVIPITAIFCKLELAVLSFLLAGGLRGRFWTAVLVSAAAQFVLVAMPPLPVFVSALLFGVELCLLINARRTGNIRTLYWLPPLIMIWANVDPNFVYGIFALLLFVAPEVFKGHGFSRAETAPSRESPRGLQPARLALVFCATLLASILTPYGWAPYGEFFTRLTTAANDYLPTAMSLRFRGANDYVLLLLMASAFLALGIRRSRDPFSILLLLLCASASFRAQRDAWLALLAAVAVIGDFPSMCLHEPAVGDSEGVILSGAVPHSGSAESKDPFPREDSSRRCHPEGSALHPSQLLLAAAIAVVLLAIAAAIHFPRNRGLLMHRVGKHYPVAASDFIRDNHLPQPLFNPMPWGGFVEWYLPEYPAAIDGRAGLYPDDYLVEYFKVMNADQHFSTFAPLNNSGTLLLEKDSLMGKALPTVPGFKTAYSDDVAIVLTREQPTP